MAKFQKKQAKQKKESPFKNTWEKKNWIFIGIGGLLLIIGYIIMSQGSFQDSMALTVSPLILLVAYLVIFPLAILKKRDKKESDDISQS